MMFLAIHAPIPWKGLLLAYGAGQLAATLPVTPGGLGVVEGSITVALVAFGGAEASTPYAVLLYRIISFWFILARRVALHRPAGPPGAPGPLAAPGHGERRRGGAGCLRHGGRRPRRRRPRLDAVRVTPGRNGQRGRSRSIRRPRDRRGASAPRPPSCSLAASLLTACSAARIDLGTTDESCYLALPTAAKAVGEHAHLAGVRKFTLAGLRGVAPRLYGRMAHHVPQEPGRLPGRLHRPLHPSSVSKPLGQRRRHARRRRGHDRRATTCSGTLILTKTPGALPARLLTRSERARDPLGPGRHPSISGSTPSGARARCRSGRTSTVNEPRPPVSARRSTA